MSAGFSVADSAEKTWSGRLYKELGYGIISDNDVTIDRDSNQTIERAYSIFRKI